MAVGKPSGAPSVSRSGKTLTITSKTASGAFTYWLSQRSRTAGGTWSDWTDGKYPFGVMDSSRKRTVSGTSGREYQFRTRGGNKGGPYSENVPTEYGEFSAVASFTMPTTPKAVDNVTIEIVSSTSIKATWPAADNGGATLTGYDVQLRSGLSSATVEDEVSLDSGTRTKTWTGLQAGEFYRVRVTPKNDIGSGSFKNSSLIQLGSKPTAPLVVFSRNGKVTWVVTSDGGSAITGWKLEIHDGFSWSSVLSFPATTLQHQVANRIPGIGYQARVKAVNAAGESVAGLSLKTTSDKCSCT